MRIIVRKIKISFRKVNYKQIRSDVEIGTYLSGGIDSGILNLIASKKLKNIKSFTCGFD